MAKKVTFTSNNDTLAAGDWVGIFLYDKTTNTVLEDCTISDAGRDESSGRGAITYYGAKPGSAIAITDPTGGACPTMCSDLNQAYMDTVQQAKSCCPDCASPQCGQKVWNALPTGCPCPCETFIQPKGTTLQKLKTLEQQWVSKGCGAGFPPPVDMTCCALYPACQPVKRAICSPQGTCQDQV